MRHIEVTDDMWPWPWVREFLKHVLCIIRIEQNLSFTVVVEFWRYCKDWWSKDAFKCLWVKKWEAEKTDVLLHRISKIWSTPLVYSGSDWNFLKYVITCTAKQYIEVWFYVTKIDMFLILYLKMRTQNCVQRLNTDLVRNGHVILCLLVTHKI